MKKICLLLSLTLLGAWTLDSTNSADARTKYRARIERSMTIADRLLLKGKYEEAAAIYKQSVNRNSRDVNAVVGLGTALAEQFKLDAAEEQFRKALAVDPQMPQAHVGLAKVNLYRLQSSSMTYLRNRPSALVQAESETREALRLDPGMPEAHFQMGMVLKEQGRLVEAAKSFSEAIKNDPTYSQGYAGLGLTQLMQRNIVGAQSNFRRAISLNSGNSTAHFGLAKSYLAQNQVDKALKELNIALYQNRNAAPVHVALGEAYETQGNYNAAIKHYRDAIRIKPENAEAYVRIAGIREFRGDIEHSIAELRGSLELMPNNVILRSKLGEQLLRIEKFDDAIKEYKQVVAANPGDAMAVKGLTRAFYLKASKETSGAFLASNDFETAEAALQEAIKLNPADLELRLAEAKMRSLSGKPVDLKAVGTPRNNAERFAYAEALLAQNNFREAAAQMHTVITSVNTAREAAQVGELAMLIRDLESAEAAFKKAKTLPGGNDRATRGLVAVAKAREQSRQDFTLAQDLASKKQLNSAIDKYRASIYAFPTFPNARLGLAKTLERLSKPQPEQLRESARNYRAYTDLAVNLPQKEHAKYLKHATALDERAYKVEQKNVVAARK